ILLLTSSYREVLTTSNKIKKIMTKITLGTEGQVPCPTRLHVCLGNSSINPLLCSSTQLDIEAMALRIGIQDLPAPGAGRRTCPHVPIPMSLVKRKFPVYFINNLFFFDCFMYNEIKIFIQ